MYLGAVSSLMHQLTKFMTETIVTDVSKPDNFKH